MYVLDKENIGNYIIIKTVLQQAKTVYGEDQYPVLKAFYGRIIQSERAGVFLSKN